ncbi:hypothetical protein ABZW30_08365 [Kitasatospora sp. NPDC004669]|uniref:hypothetical protein n=1 Tax=Kitasatospora sp. NPDC004669 TaxID=3154555 RepID=UPI0033B0BE9A
MIRSLLDTPGSYAALAAAVHRDDLRATAFQATRSLIEQTIDAGQPWPTEAARWLSLADAGWATSAAFCNQIAWYARTRHNSATTYLTGTSHLLHPGTDRTYARALVHLQLVALRYDFRCRSIQKILDQAPEAQRNQWDPYTRALHAFALLGQSHLAGLPTAQRSLEEAGDNLQVCHALLHGLWLGTDLPDQAEHILRLAARPVFDRGDPVMLLRTAGALRALGRRQEALTAIDEAMEALDPNAPEFHADLVRERALITGLPRHAGTGPAR